MRSPALGSTPSDYSSRLVFLLAVEIVLQWLDDLDDAVFAAVLAWASLRRKCLGVGLVSSLALASCAGSAAY
jgi:hypothetical protein